MALASAVLAGKVDVEGLFAHAQLVGERVHRESAVAKREQVLVGRAQNASGGRIGRGRLAVKAEGKAGMEKSKETGLVF